MPLPTRYDVIIAGAGIIGASIAWHATRNGLKVAVLDASGPAAAASGASDGAVSVASKRPGVVADLAGASLTYCKQLSENGGVLSGVFHARPSLLFARSEAESSALDGLKKMLSDQNLPVRVNRDGAASQSTVTGFGGQVSRVLELSGEGHMLGYEAVHRFLSDRRITRHWPCRLDGFEAHHNGVTLQTGLGEMQADKLVIASGMGSSNLVAALPLRARSGQLIVTDRSTGRTDETLPGSLTSAAYLLDKSAPARADMNPPVVIDPLATGQLLIGSSREDGGNEAQVDMPTVRRILGSAVDTWPALAQRRIIRVFAGVRTASEDGFPIIGSLPETPNVIMATAFEGDGICLAPLVGKEVTAILTGDTIRSGISTLTPARFCPNKAAAG